VLNGWGAAGGAGAVAEAITKAVFGKLPGQARPHSARVGTCAGS
jgi:hypothetical protein